MARSDNQNEWNGRLRERSAPNSEKTPSKPFITSVLEVSKEKARSLLNRISMTETPRSTNATSTTSQGKKKVAGGVSRPDSTKSQLQKKASDVKKSNWSQGSQSSTKSQKRRRSSDAKEVDRSQGSHNAIKKQKRFSPKRSQGNHNLSKSQNKNGPSDAREVNLSQGNHHSPLETQKRRHIPGDLARNDDFISLYSNEDEFPAPKEVNLLKRKREDSPRKFNGKSTLEINPHRVHKEVNFTPAPWISESAGYRDLEYEQVTDMLKAECIDFVNYIMPTPEEHQLRTWAVHRISCLVTSIWPGSNVHCFGSYQTLLYLPTGDLDIVVLNPKIAGGKNDLRRLARALHDKRVGYKISIISNAKVPIVKFTETVTGFEVDISFNKSNGPTSANIVKSFLTEYPMARYLIMILKYFLKTRNLHEPFNGGVGSYSLICLVISFIQMHPRLRTDDIRAETNIGILLIEFLELYGKHFNYDEVGISIVDGGSYYSKLKRSWFKEWAPFLLSIEDPQDPTNDIAVASRNIINVRQAFAGAFEILTSGIYGINNVVHARRHGRFFDMNSAKMNGIGVANSLLVQIIPVRGEMHSRREKLAHLYEACTMQRQLERDSFVKKFEIPDVLPDPRELIFKMIEMRNTVDVDGSANTKINAHGNDRYGSTRNPVIEYVSYEDEEVNKDSSHHKH